MKQAYTRLYEAISLNIKTHQAKQGIAYGSQAQTAITKIPENRAMRVLTKIVHGPRIPLI